MVDPDARIRLVLSTKALFVGVDLRLSEWRCQGIGGGITFFLVDCYSKSAFAETVEWLYIHLSKVGAPPLVGVNLVWSGRSFEGAMLGGN